MQSLQDFKHLIHYQAHLNRFCFKVLSFLIVLLLLLLLLLWF